MPIKGFEKYTLPTELAIAPLHSGLKQLLWENLTDKFY